MKTKGIILLLTILLLVALTACGTGSEETTAPAANDGTTAVDTTKIILQTETPDTTKAVEPEVKPSEGLSLSFDKESNGYNLTWLGTCTDTTVIIPSVHEGKSVVGVAPWALSGCNSFNAIAIPDSIVTMGNDVFKNCTNLVSVFCEAESMPDGWNAEWLNGCSATVYWGNEWHYVDGVPTLK